MVTSIWRFTVVPLTNDGASNPTAPANWSRRAQIIYTGETEYWRVYQVDGSGNIDFGDWIETPKRSEITALNSSSLFYRSPTVTSITSNTDLWNMGTGIYLISLSSASEYIPNRWGILVVFSCMTDAAYFYITTSGESYLRIAYNLKAGTPAWRYDWKRIDNS